MRTPVTGASLKEIFYELGRIRDEDVTEKELSDAKTYLNGIFSIRLETQEGLVDQLVQVKMHNLPEEHLRTYSARVNAVTREHVRRVAQKYVLPDRVAVVVVGDTAAIADQVKPYAGEVENYDSAGNRRQPAANTGMENTE